MKERGRGEDLNWKENKSTQVIQSISYDFLKKKESNINMQVTCQQSSNCSLQKRK
jgi:hypothetical protein